VGHRHSRSEILQGALEAALDDGLSQLTFGRLAKRLEISDRIVVYYFPTKADLIAAVIAAMAFSLQDALTDAFDTPVVDHREMIRRAWPVVATPANDRVFSLFLEANGLASIGVEPYATLVPPLMTAWIDWATELIDGIDDERHAEAAAAIAAIDGVYLIRLLVGPEAADRAVDALTGSP
jgi:AcrR family transcriptional regulator